MAEFQLERLLKHLTSRGVDFVVVGGIAATLLGSAHETFDLDICPAADAENLEQLGSALLELDARLRGIEEVRAVRARRWSLEAAWRSSRSTPPPGLSTS